MKKIEELINDIINVVEDDEVANKDEYILMELRSNVEEIINNLYEEVKERII